MPNPRYSLRGASTPSASEVANRPPARPVALVALLENTGHIHGLRLPPWATAAIDWATEEYAKRMLRVYGAHSRYDRVILLEDERATAENLISALIEQSAGHTVDLLLLVHGQDGCLVGHRGRNFVDAADFDALQARLGRSDGLLDLRVVYGLNCYGASLATTWMALGAHAVNGSLGVNWLPEPSLSLFLHKWLNGASFAEAVVHSAGRARAVGRLLWRDRADGSEHPCIAGSRQVVYGLQDVTIASATGRL